MSTKTKHVLLALSAIKAVHFDWLSGEISIEIDDAVPVPVIPGELPVPVSDVLEERPKAGSISAAEKQLLEQKAQAEHIDYGKANYGSVSNENTAEQNLGPAS